MSLIRIDRHPSRRQLHVFGAVWLVFFGVLGGIVYAATGSSVGPAVLWTLAVVVPTVGWLSPGWMRIVYLGMAYAALPLGLAVSYSLLAIVYYLVLTPIGLIMRLCGRDPMHRELDRSAKSYWVERTSTEDFGSYFRQY